MAVPDAAYTLCVCLQPWGRSAEGKLDQGDDALLADPVRGKLGNFLMSGGKYPDEASHVPFRHIFPFWLTSYFPALFRPLPTARLSGTPRPPRHIVLQHPVYSWRVAIRLVLPFTTSEGCSPGAHVRGVREAAYHLGKQGRFFGGRRAEPPRPARSIRPPRPDRDLRPRQTAAHLPLDGGLPRRRPQQGYERD